jgi:uncharacterized protein (DUF2147 family)
MEQLPTSRTGDAMKFELGTTSSRSTRLAPGFFKRSLLAILMLGMSAMPGLAAKASAPVPSGRWLWDTGDAAIEFHPCGDALCARVIWLRNENTPRPQAMLDVQNPDPTLRSRRVCGIDYITGVRQTRAGKWENGRIYDFQGGASYDLDVTVVTTDRIDMRGYKAIRMLGTTLHLVPAPADLRPCSSGPAPLGQVGTP